MKGWKITCNIASYTCNLFQYYFKGAKIWWLFAQLYKNPTSLIILCWLGVLSNKSQLGVDFKIRISFASQEKEKKILCIANEEMGTTTILDNSKSKEGQGDY